MKKCFSIFLMLTLFGACSSPHFDKSEADRLERGLYCYPTESRWGMGKLPASSDEVLDAITTALNVIGTWWLTRSYIQQWWIWIVADVFAIWMNLNLGNTWFVVQFVLCIISSFVGLWNWSKNGKYLNA